MVNLDIISFILFFVFFIFRLFDNYGVDKSKEIIQMTIWIILLIIGNFFSIGIVKVSLIFLFILLIYEAIHFIIVEKLS